MNPLINFCIYLEGLEYEKCILLLELFSLEEDEGYEMHNKIHFIERLAGFNKLCKHFGITGDPRMQFRALLVFEWVKDSISYKFLRE